MVIVTSPAKIILFGEHAVVYGKTAIATSLNDLRATIELTPSDSMTINIEGDCIGVNQEFSIPSLQVPTSFSLSKPEMDLNLLNEIKLQSKSDNIVLFLCSFTL
jgi:mevalonate kinase